MICKNCGSEHDRGEGQLCFRCHVKGISFTFRGGAIKGKRGFHMTQGDWLREHMEVDSEKQLAKRTDIEKV